MKAHAVWGTFALLKLIGAAQVGSGANNDTVSAVNGFSQLQAWNVSMTASSQFPEWLTKFTGLREWPGTEPPYIPLDFIDMSKIPKHPRREPGTCPVERDQCSFDCFKCVSHDDVYTCPKLSQTFDDGPSPHTMKLVHNLKTPSTFFTLGVNVVRYPDIYRQLMGRGHLMASHTWSHKFLPALSNEEIIAQFEWSIWAMNATGSHLPKYYRPPYGGIDDRVRAIARMFGLQAVVWDHDSFDWQMESKPPQRTRQHIVNDMTRWKNSGKGGIILEHDVYESTINAALEAHEIIGTDQLTVDRCVGGARYIREF